MRIRAARGATVSVAVEEELEQRAVESDVHDLGETVGKLAFGADVDELEVEALHKPAQVVLPAKEVHGALSHPHIGGDRNACFAVDEDWLWTIDVDTKLTVELAELHVGLAKLAATSDLGLCGAVADHFDELGGPIGWSTEDHRDMSSVAGELPRAVNVAVHAVVLHKVIDGVVESWRSMGGARRL